ncbi:MAG: RICIN domain-containing protein [Bacteroidaceae bacterium]|nr:RICIN domain-containing protein [Bacteroidaceae bacterium]
MRKTLRLTLLTLFVALVSTNVFATVEDYTSKLWNADIEEGMPGWNITFTGEITTDSHSGYIWETQYRAEGSNYFGFYNKCLQVWSTKNSDLGRGNFVGASSASQLLTNLPNGTYVFGVAATACIQYVDGQEDSNAADVYGAYVFANDSEEPIATDNPDGGFYVVPIRRFNAATTVTDGTLNVGVKTEADCHVSFITFDNARLYYAGDVTTDAALLDVYKLDLQEVVDEMNVLKENPMNADSLAALNAAIEMAQAATDVDGIINGIVAIRTAFIPARKSVNDYKGLKDVVEKAKEVAAKKWSDQVQDYLEDLKAAIEDAEAALAAGELTRDDVAALKAALQEASDLVAVDEIYDLINALQTLIDFPEDLTPEDLVALGLAEDYEFPGFAEADPGTEVGKVPYKYVESLTDLMTETADVLDQIGDTKTAAEGMTYITKIRSAVAEAIANITPEPTLPLQIITIPDPNDISKPLYMDTGWTGNDYVNTFKSESPNGYECFRYESPQITLPYPINTLVITVLHVINDRSVNASTDGPYFNINEFYLYDADGNDITPLDPSYYGSNAKETSEGSYEALYDRSIGSFFHSAWSSPAAPAEFYHNLQVKIPDDMLTFSLAIEIEWSDTRIRNMPSEIVFTGLSSAKSDLGEVIKDAGQYYNRYSGDEPGFYKADFTAFRAAYANAKAVYENEDATDAEMAAAIDALEATEGPVDEAIMNMPEPGVEYHLTSGVAEFFAKQDVIKNMTVLQDTIAWWDNGAAGDKNQLFTFEPLGPNENGDACYKVKNVGTGKYLGNFHNEAGTDTDGSDIDWGNPWHVRLNDVGDTIILKSVGQGQFNMFGRTESGDWLCLHACNHNNGNASTDPGSQGGGKSGVHPNGFSIHGVCGPIVQWSTGAGGASAWFIRQVDELPLSALVEGATVKTRLFHLFKGVNMFTIAADKACDFADLALTDVAGEPIEFTSSKAGNSVTVALSSNIETFAVSFTNTEGVSVITINGGVSKLSELQKAYDAAVANEYLEGNDIGCVKDLKAYNAALENAENLLNNGGSDQEIDAAIAAIDAAIAGLEIVMPEEGKQYFIINGTPAFKDNFGVEMAMCADSSKNWGAWTYLNVASDDYVWEFVPADEGTYYLKNVGTGKFMGGADGKSTCIELREVASQPFELVSVGSQQFNIHDARPGSAADWCLHAIWHSSGSGKWGGICYWGTSANNASAWYIRDASSLRTEIDVISAEPATIERFAEGIYDLTGRRVENPENGLYIVNGKKVLFK